MGPEVSVIIPTIPPRREMLKRAVASVMAQTHPVSDILIPVDWKKEGAARNRQRGLDKVTTELYLPVDDDDCLYPWALEKMVPFLLDNGADMVYGWYDVVGGTDPRPEVFGQPFDPANPVQTTVVVLGRTELAKDIGGWVHEDDELANLTHVDRLYHGEDYLLIDRAIKAGAKIMHLPEKVFEWYHHGSNLSGLPKW